MENDRQRGQIIALNEFTIKNSNNKFDNINNVDRFIIALSDDNNRNSKQKTIFINEFEFEINKINLKLLNNKGKKLNEKNISFNEFKEQNTDKTFTNPSSIVVKLNKNEIDTKEKIITFGGGEPQNNDDMNPSSIFFSFEYKNRILYEHIPLKEFLINKDLNNSINFILSLKQNNGDFIDKQIIFQNLTDINQISKIELKIINNGLCYTKTILLSLISFEIDDKKICCEDYDEEDYSKLKINVDDLEVNNKKYSNIFFKDSIFRGELRFCKTIKNYIKIMYNVNDGILEEYENKYIFKFKISLNNDVKISEDLEIKKENQEYTKNNCRLSYLCYKFWFLIPGKFIRILLQIGEIYFSLILLGFIIEIITILLTSTKKFETDLNGFWCFLTFSCLVVFVFFIPFLLFIIPLAIQFWEAFQFRYIKEKNPLITLVRIFTNDDNIGYINRIFHIALNIFFLIVFIILIVSLFEYENNSSIFEYLNSFLFIIFPLLKFSIIFLGNCYVGARIIINRLCCFGSNCKKCKEKCKECICRKFIIDNEEEFQELVRYDKFSTKIEHNEIRESFGELEPIKLLMYNEDDFKDKKNPCFLCKFFYIIFGIVIFLIIYIASFFTELLPLSVGFIVFMIVVFLICFLVSIAVSHQLFIFNAFCKCGEKCNCKYCEKKNQDNVVSKVEEKYAGLSFWIYSIIVLIFLFILFLAIYAIKNDNLEFQSVEERLGSMDKFNNIPINDYTEEHFSRYYVKSPMCFTTIHHLNLIQLAALTQAAYITKKNDIEIAKNIFYENTIFKDSDIKISKMTFLTDDKEDIAVVLRTDIEVPNSSKNLIVFSIRGSFSNRDWILDLEMYSPSVIFTLIRMIPLIQRTESSTSKVLNSILTFPLYCMEKITLLKLYTNQIIEKVDKIIQENKENSEFIFVGHSLGGGLSKYIASKYKKQSFSVSGPGVTPLEIMDINDNGNKFFKSNFIDIVPDNDIVPRFEISGGIKYRVICNKNLLNCHSIDRTICMMGLMCEQEEYTKRLCLSMPNIGEKEYNKMQIFKNGENFCNHMLTNESEKNICKARETTSEEYKCCYVHLNYMKKNDIKPEDEYKCLQFNPLNQMEIENYKAEIMKKYLNSKVEIICG